MRAALIVLACAQVAHADPDPDPAAQRAADANLASQARRRGLTFQAAVGGALSLGFGFDETVERGPGVSLRLGTVATPHVVLTIELANFTLLHKVATEDGMATTHKNFVNHGLVGAQFYVNPALWVRGGVGVGHYAGDNVKRPDDTIGDLRAVGVAFAGGAGLELLRFKRGIALGLELVSIIDFNRAGALSSSSFMLDLAFD